MNTRDDSVDALKGFAILLLVFVFMGYYFKQPELWLRVIFSLEMPAFYVAAGFTLARSGAMHPARYFWVRALWLLVFAALLDVVVWQKLPLLYGESLAMCALVIPFMIYLIRAPAFVLPWAFVVVVLLTPWLQATVGYGEVPANQRWWWQFAEVSFIEQAARIDWAGAARAWFIDGWSPLFPFLAHFIFGAWLAKSDWRAGGVKSILFGLTALAIAGGVWIYFPGDNMRRFNYLEMSYPPVPAYVLFTCAFAFCLLVVSDHLAVTWPKAILRHFGRAPLACFLVANVMMRFVIYPNFPKTLRFYKILGLFFAVVAAMWITIFILKRVRRALRRPVLPAPAKILFGGVGLPK